MKFPEIIAEPFQLIFSIAYFITATIMTFDIDVFDAFWEKHAVLKAIFTKILRCSAFILLILKYCLLWIPDILSVGNVNKKKENIREDKEKIKKDMHIFDDQPLIIQLFPFYILLAVLELTLQCFQIIPSRYYTLVNDFSALLTSLLGLFIVCLNSIKKHNHHKTT